MREVVVTDEVALRFERELDRGVNEIAAVLGSLDRARMAADVETLAQALRQDLVDPDDFSIRRGRR